LAISFEPGTAVEFTCYWNGEPETIRGITVEDSANNQFRIAVDIGPGQRLKSGRVIRNRSALRARTVSLFGQAGGALFDSGAGSAIRPNEPAGRHYKSR
jgi:hypothetical protein